ncbi:hypothetical protein P280DRAFT_318991 [Massarina eburnea CBS 473.64]|uniref:Wax synthase domain-containing protein n=1 Tax=Massarina eburnea CBS 473.64 TaxID=1395130 RepID=A0A6A6RJ83_9PLEO|nr:hypothetical protein P280DRAFT_318991 [Massarina eburnea CBS 473.64]
MTSHPPVLEEDFLAQLLVDAPPAIAVLLIPSFFAYLSIYALVRRWVWTGRLLVVPTLVLFWASKVVAPVRCRALEAEFNFGAAIAIMKLLELHVLEFTNAFPSYTGGKQPRPSLLALILFTELRYESFTPNPIRPWQLPKYPFSSSPEKRRFFYSEPIQWVIHVSIFILLQCLPQHILPVKALGIIFAIWNIWTALELVLRYRNSPPLFGPIYLADSLATFWTETWHNALAGPCLSLAYMPTTFILSRLRLPRSLVRSCAIVASFALMGVFHMYAMAPILSDEGMRRIVIFFVANGVCTVIEVAFWGKKRHWVRAVIAWTIELSLASWTVAKCQVADGVLSADWRGLCRAKVP